VKTYIRDRHWTAKLAAQVTAFYMKNWQWLWLVLITAIGAYAAF
jgi:hypothetical protein